MINAIQIVITLFMIIGVGYFISHKGLIDDKVAAFISKVIVNFGVPGTAIVNMTAHFTRDNIGEALISSLIAFLAIILAHIVGAVIAKVFKVDRKRRGLFIGMIAGANTMFIGLPVCQALFGDNSSYALVYDIAHSFLFWTLGIYLMSLDSEENRGFSLRNLTKILSPGFLSLLFSIAIILIGIKLPVFIEKTLSYLGSLCTPLALIYCGYVLQKSGLKSIKLSRDLIFVILGRALITPVLVLAICKIFGVSPDISKVFVTISSMPAMNNAPIMAREYGSDYIFGTQCLTVSMIVSLCVLPLWTLILGLVF